MNPDTFAYYLGFVDNSQNAADVGLTNKTLVMAGKKFRPVIDELENVLHASDTAGTEYLPKHDVLAGCAALGVVLSEKEVECLGRVFQTDAAGNIDYKHLRSIFPHEHMQLLTYRHTVSNIDVLSY